MTIVLRRILVGMPADIVDDQGAPWHSGFGKTPVAGPVAIRRVNLAGDGQADLRVHGGPEKAILGYCADHYVHWRRDLARDDLVEGAFGENFAITGLDETSVAIGDRFRVGSALIEVSQPRQPCWKLARRCRLPTMPASAIASGRLGWYFRVIEEGEASAGCIMDLCARPHADWTIARINTLYFGPPAVGSVGLAEVLTLPAMSPEFTELCRRRYG